MKLKNNIKDDNKDRRKEKTRDNEHRKMRKEERALKYLQYSNPDIKPEYKKGFNHTCGNAEGRKYTVSMALPGSILDNALTLELKTKLVGQIARAAAVFSIDEIVIYDEECKLPELENKEIDQGTCINNLLATEDGFNSNVLMAFLLKYAETPQYLRRSLFPQHTCLGRVAIMPPLCIPSHLRATDSFTYREGLVIPKSNDEEQTMSTLVDVGLDEPVEVRSPQEIDSRITVKMNRNSKVHDIVNRDEPRVKKGAYWGYRIRLANGLSGAIKKPIGFHDKCGDSPSDCKYDLIIGTSEKGSNADLYTMPKFRHLLVVFGGICGIEYAQSQDQNIPKESHINSIFKAYLNTCPNQGSRTIRTEEAIPITFSTLRSFICKQGKN